MLKTFIVIALICLLWLWGIPTLVNMGVTMAAQEKTLVEVTDAKVEHLQGNLFRVSANGTVRTSGWVVNLSPLVYVRPPETWVIEAVGIKPTGPVLEVITPWTATVEMSFTKETRQVSVKGSNRSITKPIPW